MIKATIYTDCGRQQAEAKQDAVLLELGKLRGCTIKDIKLPANELDGELLLLIERDGASVELAVDIVAARINLG